MRIRPLLIALTLAGGLAVAPAATAATASASTRASNPGPIVGVHGLHRAVGVHLPQTSLPRAGSDNQPWSGYVDVADPNVALRYVASSFNVPTLRCPSSGQADVSIWVGINGLNQTNGTVEQDGVDGVCNNGLPTYYLWYEIYPEAKVPLYDINPGDSIGVSVYFTGSSYQMTLDDKTTGASTSVPGLDCPSGHSCPNTTAEVIAEDYGGGVAGGNDLADFGSLKFSDSVVTSRDGTHGTLSPNSLWSSTEISMEDPAGNIMAQPSGLSDGGADYTDVYKRSS
jgi:hypothetical protein